jgi:hypothetical protein
MRKAHIIASFCAITMVVGLVLLPATVLANFGHGSCESDGNPCMGNTGNIQNNSCNGTFACLLNKGDIQNNSCNGGGACASNTGDIQNNSCNSEDLVRVDFACGSNTGDIQNNSCNGG